jgi:cytochrome c oxidase subunit 3
MSYAEQPGREPSFKMSARQLGVLIGLVTLSVLFLATIVAYVIALSQSEVWRAAPSPGLPWGLFGSTLFLIGVSGSMHAALRAVRANRFTALTQRLGLSLAFALAFLAGQGINWLGLSEVAMPDKARTLYILTFAMLTGLHAAHVLAGFVPLGIVMARANKRQYSSSRHDGLLFCTQYWDFLGVVWLVLLAVIVLAP